MDKTLHQIVLLLVYGTGILDNKDMQQELRFFLGLTQLLISTFSLIQLIAGKDQCFAVVWL